VCDRRHLASLATTIYFAGVMTGGLLFGFMSDCMGRLPIMLFTLYLSVGVGVAISFAPSYIIFVVLRFIQGMLMQVWNFFSFNFYSLFFPVTNF
jgi:MFS family permease